MSTRAVRSAAAVTLLLAVAGCTSSGEPSASITSGEAASPSASSALSDDPGTLVTDPQSVVATWRAVELDGRAVDPDLRVGRRHLDITFDPRTGKRWTWQSTDLCNTDAGTYTVDDKGAFEATVRMSTLIHCTSGNLVGERNIDAISRADQAWLAPGGGDEPARLTLMKDGEPVAVYVEI